MAGKKGMKWKKRAHSITVKEALATNEGRLPDLLDDLYELSTDPQASRKERIDAKKFLIQTATSKSAETPGKTAEIEIADEALADIAMRTQEAYRELFKLQLKCPECGAMVYDYNKLPGV